MKKLSSAARCTCQDLEIFYKNIFVTLMYFLGQLFKKIIPEIKKISPIGGSGGLPFSALRYICWYKNIV